MLISRVTCLRILVPLLATIAVCSQAGASSRYILTAKPLDVHNGDTIYLSGSGFPPNTPLTITSECDDQSGKPSGQVAIGKAGPTTNSRGQLVAAPFQLPTFPSRLLFWCQLVPSFAEQGKGLVFPARGIVDTYVGDTIDPVYLTPTISYSLKHRGTGWFVQLESWPGARLQAVIGYFPSHKVQHINRTLDDWQGRLSIKVPRGALIGKPARRTIRVTVASTFAGHQGNVDACWSAKTNSKVNLIRCF